VPPSTAYRSNGARGPRLAAHRPLQIFPNDLLVVDEHAIGHRIVVADDRVDQFVDECVGVETEFLHRPRNHILQECRAREIGVRVEPGVEARGHARRLRHAADAGRQIHRSAALGNRELTEQEERRTRLGGDPVRVPSPGVQVRHL
jgi:hypothetical protein